MRRALRFLVFLLLLLALAAGAAYLYLRRSLPTVEGEIEVAGLVAPVEILRDAYGIPHIFAASIADTQFALGFVHAQDRLWQMEMNRRIGSGRLSEVIGPAGLETDRFLRTLGVRRTAKANLHHYDAQTLRELEAYAAGVNAFLATKPVLPPEFWLLGTRPEPWTPVDSVVWTKMMAWDLGGNWRNELLRLRMTDLEPERLEEFFPPYPGDPPLKALGFTGGASNSWVVNGTRSASGKPLLANDPHLGLTAPSVWYFAQLSAPGLEVIGASLPGVPGVLLGRTERIAWAFTNTGPDVQDLYLEKPGAKFLEIEEVIKVRGAPDEPITIRLSRHGPVISDASRAAKEAAPPGYALAMAWTALAEDDLTMQAGLKLSRARDWDEFLDALREFHVPQQNITYADVEGNIGFIAAGKVPLRQPGNAGLAPAPGWDPRYEWAGFIPFEELPREYNPASGAIVTANQKIVPPGYRHHISAEWEPPYRARRIEELLAAVPKHGAPSFARIQIDTVSPAARELLPYLLQTKPDSKQAAEALQVLAAWDGNMAAERIEPLLLAAWWRELARGLFADELGAAFPAAWSTRAPFLINVLADRDGQSRWCDDVRTAGEETCARLLSQSLETALNDLRRRYGDEPKRWSWGEAHQARSRHRPLSRDKWLRRVFDITVPSPGGPYTVNVGRMDFADDAEPFANRHAASLRAIYDLGDPQASLFIHAGGQSGNPLSEHYRSFAAAWARGEYVPMVSERSRLEAAGVQRLVLRPRR